MSHISTYKTRVPLVSKEALLDALNEAAQTRTGMTFKEEVDGIRVDWSELVTGYATHLDFKFRLGKYVPVGDNYGTKNAMFILVKDVTKYYVVSASRRTMIKVKYTKISKVQESTAVELRGRRY